ncbi:DUF1254 domain-containing protein [Paeniglutamicibacter sp. NPDC012692]|uniref:DUF1254 domain-containing protein n=1 Tax=Paeniglutamicibacter sp. NPDC012692 TaxID=3364388 RepID=UPI00367C983C
MNTVQPSTPPPQSEIGPADARSIGKDAYTYGFPMVDGYRIMHAYFVDRGNPEFKAPWNQLRNIPRVYTSDDTTVQTPNSDTPYSMLGLDLRAEPIVLTVPKIEQERYFSIQLIDLYTHNFAYIGSRTTGNDGGSFLVAGPGWNGETPAGVAAVFRSETELALAVYRTQLFNPEDLENVKTVQSGYITQPLSTFLGQPTPPDSPLVDFPKPLTPAEEESSLAVFDLLGFLLQFCPIHPSEAELRERFARIGIAAGRSVGFDKLDPGVREGFERGIQDAWHDFAALRKQMDAGEIGSGQLFGTREYLQNNYLYRMAAAKLGIYGNSQAEAMYPLYGTDAEGRPLDGASRYTLRFAPGELPPVNAFWSVTMYNMPRSLLVANPLGRYLINSRMLPLLARDPDGGLTLMIQHDSPGEDRNANWLPAPVGPFMIAMRLYWPKDEALAGQWTAPPLQRTERRPPH